MSDKAKNPKEIDVFNRFSRFNKLRTILIAIAIAIVSFCAIYFFSKSLLVYTITIIPDGGLVYGEEIEVSSYRFLDKTKAPVGFKKEGYYIEGYYCNANMTDRYTFGKSIWKSATLYVNWQPGYAVTLEFADGEEELSNMSLDYLKTYHEQYVKPNSEYTLHAVINDIPFVSGLGQNNHEGEQLLWFENPECTGEPIEIKTYKVDRNIPLYGKWFDTNAEKFDISSDGTLNRYLGYCNKVILPSTVNKIKSVEPSEFITGSSNQLNNADGAKLSAFQNVLRDLETIYINKECVELGDCAFRSCENLKNVYFKGNQLNNIGEYAFAFCSAITSIEIPESATDIERRAFYGTTGLRYISGLNGVESIGDEVFINSSIKSIDLPSVVHIGKLAFSGCYSLNSLILRSPSIVSTNVTIESGTNCNNVLYLSNTAKIYVSSNLVSTYKATSPWSYYRDRIYDISTLSI